MKKHALILVDLQNDFLPGGALAVPGGDEVVPLANQLIKQFEIVVATQDWHPVDHGSFAASHPGMDVFDQVKLGGLPQTLWPVHCVQGTTGAEFSKDLAVAGIDRVFPKGMDREIDSYSGFFDNGHRRSTGLAEWLKGKEVSKVTVCGLALDYCVKYTALDALTEGFEVALHLPACRGVDLQVGDCDQAVEELLGKGVKIIR